MKQMRSYTPDNATVRFDNGVLASDVLKDTTNDATVARIEVDTITRLKLQSMQLTQLISANLDSGSQLLQILSGSKEHPAPNFLK